MPDHFGRELDAMFSHDMAATDQQHHPHCEVRMTSRIGTNGARDPYLHLRPRSATRPPPRHIMLVGDIVSAEHILATPLGTAEKHSRH